MPIPQDDPRWKLSHARTAVIREEHGEYCVRSEKPGSSWSGGCYRTKEKAEARLRQVEHFKYMK